MSSRSQSIPPGDSRVDEKDIDLWTPAERPEREIIGISWRRIFPGGAPDSRCEGQGGVRETMKSAVIFVRPSAEGESLYTDRKLMVAREGADGAGRQLAICHYFPRSGLSISQAKTHLADVLRRQGIENILLCDWNGNIGPFPFATDDDF
ncbi:hypothetical protein ACFL0Q_06155 [Thermodesulfobacteriota bacterium]